MPNAHFNTQGVSKWDVPPSEARKFCIGLNFETEIVQFNEYFRVQI